MPIPVEILAVERPKNTKVKKSGDRYLVIKRTCKRINGKNIPVDLGTIGEIVDGKYVEIRKEPKRKNNMIDVKDYGVFKLFNDSCFSLFKDLSKVFEINTAKRIYVISLLRAIDKDIRNRDISFSYETSFASEIFPGLSLSENTVSKFLMKLGMEYRYIQKFIEERVKMFEDKTQVIDGTLIDNNSTVNDFSEFSRKAKTKGSKDLTLVYSYDIESKEPVAMKTYQGNMLDSTSINDFLSSYDIKKQLIVLDYTKKNIESFKGKNELAFIIPLKNSSKLISENKMCENIAHHLKGYEEGTVLYKKHKIDDNTFLYAFKNLKNEYEQKMSFISYNEKNEKYDDEEYLRKDKEFGVIVFESNKDLDPLEVYLAYMKRWEIETMFQMMKGIIDLDTVNVHNDYSVIATEFVNYITVIMAQKVKLRLKEVTLPSKGKNKEGKSIAETYTYKQAMRYLSKIKKVRVGDSDKWITSQTLKYINELAEALGI